MEFWFCEACGKRLTSHEMEEGKARNKKLAGVFCAQCATGVLTVETMPLTEDQARKVLGKPDPNAELMVEAKRRSSSRLLAATRMRSTGMGADRRGQRSLILPAVLAGIVCLMAGVLFLRHAGQDKPSEAANATKDAPKKAAAEPVAAVNPAAVHTPRPAAPTPPLVHPTQEVSRDASAKRLLAERPPALMPPLAPEEPQPPEKVPRNYQKPLEPATPATPPLEEPLPPSVERAEREHEDPPPPVAQVQQAKPEPAKDSPQAAWKTIFDGADASFFNFEPKSWSVVDGALQNAGDGEAIQSAKKFGDGEFRFRFEIQGCESFFIAVRQGRGGSVRFRVNDAARIKPLQGRKSEFVVRCDKLTVTAALNGEPLATEDAAKLPEGRIQVNAKGGRFRLFSVETRPVDSKP